MAAAANWNGGGQGQVSTAPPTTAGAITATPTPDAASASSARSAAPPASKPRPGATTSAESGSIAACRAEFSIGAEATGTPGRVTGPGQGQTINCSSDDWPQKTTARPTAISDASSSLASISGSPCVQDQTWGVDNRGLWVDRGCRAEFSFGGGGWRPGQGQGPDQSQIITCSSDDGRRNFCSINGSNPNSVVPHPPDQRIPCVQNQTWGVDRRRGLWVDVAARAEFQVSR